MLAECLCGFSYFPRRESNELLFMVSRYPEISLDGAILIYWLNYIVEMLNDYEFMGEIQKE